MTKSALLTFALLAAFSGPVLADIQIAPAAGYLRTRTGGALPVATTLEPNGGALLLLVAASSSTNTFTNALSPGQYVAGQDTLLGAFSFNNSGGTNGTGQTTVNSVTFNPVTLNVSAGTLVELRWFPSITLTQYNQGTTPMAGTTYGVYNPRLYAANGSSLNPDGGDPWVVPANGVSGYSLNFFTNDNTQIAGTQPFTEGYASLVVVPEPSSGVLAGLGLMVAVGAVRVWRRRSTSLQV